MKYLWTKLWVLQHNEVLRICWLQKSVDKAFVESSFAKLLSTKFSSHISSSFTSKKLSVQQISYEKASLYPQ